VGFVQTDQIAAQFEFFELLVVIDAGEPEAVDLFVLPEQGIMRAGQDGIPARHAQMSVAHRVPVA
jgi:hypothetical protein